MLFRSGKRPLVLTLGLGATAAVGFGIGTITTGSAAGASAGHRYTLRVGDRVTIPAIAQRCDVEREGGAPELFCSRIRNAHHQVTLFRGNILVWKVGNPDRPAWHGKP